jgi:hydrogenase maturation protein HypF
VPPNIATGLKVANRSAFNTFCLIKNGNAILSQHIGDLENALTYEDYQHNLALYAQLYQHSPEQIIIDCHPEYLSSKLGRQLGNGKGAGV